MWSGVRRWNSAAYGLNVMESVQIKLKNCSFTGLESITSVQSSLKITQKCSGGTLKVREPQKGWDNKLPTCPWPTPKLYTNQGDQRESRRKWKSTDTEGHSADLNLFLQPHTTQTAEGRRLTCSRFLSRTIQIMTWPLNSAQTGNTLREPDWKTK